MDVRAQVSMVFHLDKCIGCHTCSVACKNIWTDRPGAEYMWWNNVETKPGTGYPGRWEDQDKYGGGWRLTEGQELEMRNQNKVSAMAKLFYQPAQPLLKDYYEPFTYQYGDLMNAPAGEDQPTARPISQITGKNMDIQGGPNWDDDLSGSPKYAANDPNLAALSPEERAQLLEVERVAFFYLPRICNHCANPTCVAACPSGALYKRGEDGIVLVSQETCRGWRACVSACPYKKIYYNWKTGKSEKCILCYPRVETGQPPACFHSCVGRIRYMGVLLYDASKVPDALRVPDLALVESQRSVLLDPNDPRVLEGARANGISEEMIQSAQNSPVYDYVVRWKLALPLHSEYRTLPMLYYVPPLLPVMGKSDASGYGNQGEGMFTALEKARIPVGYLARLFAAGNEAEVTQSLRKLIAVRMFRRATEVGDMDLAAARKALQETGLTEAQAEAIHHLTVFPTPDERFRLPALHREEAVESHADPEYCKGNCGLGLNHPPERGA